jgi:catechol 2,3-dioxygenase-like lactoylglutathione lyase family enzyme
MPSTFRSIAPLVPAADVEQGIRFYRDNLGFMLLYRDAEPARLAVIERDGVQINLFDSQDQHLADWTSLRIKVDGIDELYAQCEAHGIVHPNGRLSPRPWGVREFSIVDLSGVCIAFYEPTLGMTT